MPDIPLQGEDIGLLQKPASPRTRHKNIMNPKSREKVRSRPVVPSKVGEDLGSAAEDGDDADDSSSSDPSDKQLDDDTESMFSPFEIENNSSTIM